jgi:molybdopterin converting factor small subunit
MILIKVKVNFYGLIKDVVDNRSQEVELPLGASVKDLLQLLVKQYGERFRNRILTKEGFLQRSVKLVVNNEQIDPSRLDHSLVPQKDRSATEVTVLIFPPVFGGHSLSPFSSLPKQS